MLLLFFLFLISCASYQKYPSEWAELVLPEDEKCLDISGSYMNSGERGDKRNSAYLSILLGFEERTATSTHVQIRQIDIDNLETSVWNEKKLVSKKRYSKENKGYSCSSKGIEIPIAKEKLEGEKAAGGAGMKITLYLTKSIDGSLIVERKCSAGGYSLLYIPVVGSSYEWYRFKPIDIIKP
jgi:hypothetical protein